MPRVARAVGAGCGTLAGGAAAVEPACGVDPKTGQRFHEAFRSKGAAEDGGIHGHDQSSPAGSAPKRGIMIRVTEIAFSCYPVTDMARARKFYEGVLGLKATHHAGEPGGMEWTEYDIGPGTLALGAGAPDWEPTASGCSVGLEVEDFDAAITHLKAQGVRFKIEPFSTPVCRMAFFYDTEGNLLCVHKRNAGQH